MIMKNPNRETVSKLEQLPNIGKKMASYLEMADIKTPKSLIGKNAFDLYNKLCEKTGKPFDPYVIDMFYHYVLATINMITSRISMRPMNYTTLLENLK